MKNNLRDIKLMFEQCGLLLRGKDYTYGFDLPNKIDLISLAGISYVECSEETKLNLIQKSVWEKNRIRILDWKLFLPNLEINKQEEAILKYTFESIKIHYVNKSFKFEFQLRPNINLGIMIKNKDFVDRLSKEFQLKAIFLPKNLLSKEIRKEISILIGNKTKEFDIIEKINFNLPRLILDNLNQ
jgi:hypothetical protein